MLWIWKRKAEDERIVFAWDGGVERDTRIEGLA